MSLHLKYKLLLALTAILLLPFKPYAQEESNSQYSSQYNKLYKAYLKNPNDVANMLAMASFYSDTVNPMRDYPMAMRFATEAESQFIAILEDRDRYKEAKRLIKKQITITLVRDTKKQITSIARKELANDVPLSENVLDSYAKAFSNDPRTMRLVESKRMQTKYQQAQKTNTLAAYRSFIETYGTTQEGEDAVNEMNRLASTLVDNAKSEDEVDQRLQGFLDMENIQDVALRKKSLIAYDKLMQHPTPKAYRDYLKKYPGSDGYSKVLEKMDDFLNQEFEQLNTPRQYADFANDYPDNPLADEAISRLKKLITEQRDMDALKIYLEEFTLDVNYNDILLQVFNWHTEEGNLSPILMFERKYPDFPYKMALQDAINAARKYDSIPIPYSFAEKDFKSWASKIYHLTGKKESFVALQRTLTPSVASQQWKKALDRINYFNLSFEDYCVDEVAELRGILERPSDKRLSRTMVVCPAYDLLHPVLNPEENSLFYNKVVDGASHIQKAVKKATKKSVVWVSTGDIAFTNIENRNIKIFSFFDQGNKMLLGKDGDILVAQRDNNSWTVIETLPKPVNSDAIEFDAFMLPDSSGILFASDRDGGQNLQPSHAFFHGDSAIASDIYFAPLSNGRWGNPINLGINVNSPYMECSPVISDDLKTLYFITDGRGGLGFGDIYYTTRDNTDDWKSWSSPVNYGKEVNSCHNEKSVSIADNGNSLLLCSNLKGRYGCYSIPSYHTINTDFTRVDISAGYVGFTAEIVDLSSKKEIGRPFSVKQNSTWSTSLHSNQSYLLYPHQEGLFIPAVLFTPADNAKPAVKVYTAESLSTLANEGIALTLYGIVFNDNKASLADCSAKELDHLADFLQRNLSTGAEIAIHVSGNDDTQCFMLSQDRAKQVKQQLVERGVHPDRIATSPYGNSQTKSGKAVTSTTLTLLSME